MTNFMTKYGEVKFFYITVFCISTLFLNLSCRQSSTLRAENLEPINVNVEETNYHGKDAVKLTEIEPKGGIALVRGEQFLNGVIELELAGKPGANADSSLRGFIGIAFRVQAEDTVRFECFYLRPTNGRANDQLRRNHSTQYISHPEYPWYVLRQQFPGVYESYVDLVAGEWTKVKVEVHDRTARLYVHGAEQPALIVNDLKQEPASGGIALWLGLGTEGYFTNLRVTKSGQ